MRKNIKIVIVVVAMVVIMIGACCSADSSKGSKPINLYYTGTTSGSHEYESFTLPAKSKYTFKGYSHSGSFSYLTVLINHALIGNLSFSAIQYDGYPVSYSSTSSPFIEVSMVHGSGSASFTGSVLY